MACTFPSGSGVQGLEFLIDGTSQDCIEFTELGWPIHLFQLRVQMLYRIWRPMGNQPLTSCLDSVLTCFLKKLETKLPYLRINMISYCFSPVFIKKVQEQCFMPLFL